MSHNGNRRSSNASLPKFGQVLGKEVFGRPRVACGFRSLPMYIASVPFGLVGITLSILIGRYWDVGFLAGVIVKFYSSILIVISAGAVYSTANEKMEFLHALFALYLAHALGMN